MPLNRGLVGKEYPRIPFSVEAAHVQSFADAVGDDGSFVSPTFVTAPELLSMALVVGDPELGLDFARVVHGEQEYEWRRPFEVGDALWATARIADIRAKGGHEFLAVETVLRDGEGTPVVLARSTLISRGTG